MVLKINDSVQAQVRNARFGDFGPLDFKAVGGAAASSSKFAPFGNGFGATGTGWSNDIWRSTSGTNDLGSVGCETTKLKGNRLQPTTTPPSDPWAKWPSQWTSAELNQSSNAANQVQSLPASQSRIHGHETSKTIPLVGFSAETGAHSALSPSGTPPITSYSNRSNTQAQHEQRGGFLFGHSQFSIHPSIYGHHHSLEELDDTITPFADPKFNDWDDLLPWKTNQDDSDWCHISSQPIAQPLRSNISMARTEVPATRQVQSNSSWVHQDFEPRLSDQWIRTSQKTFIPKHQDSKHAGDYIKDENFDVPSYSRREGVNHFREIQSIRSAQAMGQLQMGLPQAQQSSLPSTNRLNTQTRGDWNNASYTWDALPPKPFAGQFDVCRDFHSIQHTNPAISDFNYLRRFDESYRGLPQDTHKGNEVVLREARSFHETARGHLNSKDIMIPAHNHGYVGHQIQQAMAQHMRGCYPYNFGPGVHEFSIGGYAPYMQSTQLVLQPRIPPLGLVPLTDAEQGMRSALLEEFRNNVKGHRRFELRDIYGHVVEFSGDQQGARFIQIKLETANSAEKDQIFRELVRDALPLMKDVFGNWVIQKIFEHGDQSQKNILVGMMKGQVLELTTQMYGCRVVQRALEHVLVDQQICLVQELERHVLRCVKDEHGNHVIQKAIESLPEESTGFIFDALIGHIQHLAIHNFGCRVVQRLLEQSCGPSRIRIIQELQACAMTLIADRYGNYVIQNVLKHGDADDRARLNAVIKTHIVMFSKHKYGSNVVEASLDFGTNEFRREIMHLLLRKNDREENEAIGLFKDNFGNYVIQTLLRTLNPADGAFFTEQLKQVVDTACQAPNNYKQATNIAKIMHKLDISVYQPQKMQNISRPLNIDSSARSTPPLIMDDTQSPFSSSLPSTVGDAEMH